MSELHNTLLGICTYLISEDVTLHDGETIGFSAEQQLAISRSPAIAGGCRRNPENRLLSAAYSEAVGNPDKRERDDLRVLTAAHGFRPASQPARRCNTVLRL